MNPRHWSQTMYESRTNSSSPLGLKITRRRSRGTRWHCTQHMQYTQDGCTKHVYIYVGVHITRVPGTRERRREQFQKEGSDELRLSSNYRKTCLGGRERRNRRSIAWNRRERRHWSRYIYGKLILFNVTQPTIHVQRS